LNVERLVAFEENPRFVYLAGQSDTSLRRIVLLKPGTFVVEDRVQVPADGTPVRWTLLAQGELKVDGRTLNMIGPEGEIRGETLTPKDARFRVVRGDEDSRKHVVEIVAKADGQEARFLQVLQVRRAGGKSSVPRCELAQNDDGWQLTVTADAQTLKLLLPIERDAAGTIAIADADGQSLLNQRLLPSGIMPHGEKGVKLLQRWDTPYRGERWPGWDTGRVAPELKKAVEEGAAGRGRAVVLGCGGGNNAIYLASKGFDVTGVEVAPTALTRAAEKAREAGVSVRWIVADVLALPDLAPFDLIFDRGCYHHVRQYNAAGYVESVRRLSRPGTRLLLLAGRPDEERRGGPPRIKEKEIRSDFSALFEFEWFREIRFDLRNPDAKGPLAWSVMMRRKGGAR
jgi:SAM-dependent methyltransferase